MTSRVALLTDKLRKLVGQTVRRPTGSLSGHAAGLPFERLVDEILKTELPSQTFRHFELLNELFSSNPDHTTVDERYSLLGPPSLQYLLRRGKKATKQWSTANQFEEKQNDTAEIVILPSKRLAIELDRSRTVSLVDVKTQNDEKKAQAPNIISAEKLAHACLLATRFESCIPFELIYVGVKWRAEADHLVCTGTRVISMSEIDPKRLYINWAAALQIQFHPFEVVCDYEKDGLSWARDYLTNFCDQLEKRIRSDQEKLMYFRSWM